MGRVSLGRRVRGRVRTALHASSAAAAAADASRWRSASAAVARSLWASPPPADAGAAADAAAAASAAAPTAHSARTAATAVARARPAAAAVRPSTSATHSTTSLSRTCRRMRQGRVLCTRAPHAKRWWQSFSSVPAASCRPGSDGMGVTLVPRAARRHGQVLKARADAYAVNALCVTRLKHTPRAHCACDVRERSLLWLQRAPPGGWPGHPHLMRSPPHVRPRQPAAHTQPFQVQPLFLLHTETGAPGNLSAARRGLRRAVRVQECAPQRGRGPVLRWAGRRGGQRGRCGRRRRGGDGCSRGRRGRGRDLAQAARVRAGLCPAGAARQPALAHQKHSHIVPFQRCSPKLSDRAAGYSTPALPNNKAAF